MPDKEHRPETKAPTAPQQGHDERGSFAQSDAELAKVLQSATLKDDDPAWVTSATPDGKSTRINIGFGASAGAKIGSRGILLDANGMLLAEFTVDRLNNLDAQAHVPVSAKEAHGARIIFNPTRIPPRATQPRKNVHARVIAKSANGDVTNWTLTIGSGLVQGVRDGMPVHYAQPSGEPGELVGKTARTKEITTEVDIAHTNADSLKFMVVINP